MPDQPQPHDGCLDRACECVQDALVWMKERAKTEYETAERLRAQNADLLRALTAAAAELGVAASELHVAAGSLKSGSVT